MNARFLCLTALAATVSSAFAETVVLGKLGQATVSEAIYSRPRSNSRVYYRCKPYEYLVLQSTNDDRWLKVLMSNGASGYIESEGVAKLPYQVTMDRASAFTSSRGSLGSRGEAARNALHYVGTPYVWGGNDPNSGIDCSGFVKQMYGSIGINLPRTAAEQALVGKPILTYQELQPGDRLYFWESKRGKIGHTGMYLGSFQGKPYFIHSSHGHHGVATDVLSEKWQKILVAARR